MRTSRNHIARALLENNAWPGEWVAMRLALEDAQVVLDAIRNCFTLGLLDLGDLLDLEVAA